MEFWVKSLQARTQGAILKAILSKADLSSEEEVKRLLSARELVWRCLEDLAVEHETMMRVEKQDLEGKSGVAEEGRRNELEGFIRKEAFLKYPASSEEIVLSGIPTPIKKSEVDRETGVQKGAANEDTVDDDYVSIWRGLKLPVARDIDPASEMEPVAAPNFESVQEQGLGQAEHDKQEQDKQEFLKDTAPLQAWISDLAAKERQIFEIAFLANWVQLIEWLEEKQGSLCGEGDAMKSIMKWEDFARDLADEPGERVGGGKLFQSSSDLRVATEVMHDLGYLLHFGQDEELGKLVFLSPQKVIDLLKVIVQHNSEEKLQYRPVTEYYSVGGRRFL
jgi:hypothetical protein